jgi:UDP-N-acetylmuramoyl-L-alanyl-D-glutamate--2,6-diaminopimelate ligase
VPPVRRPSASRARTRPRPALRSRDAGGRGTTLRRAVRPHLPRCRRPRAAASAIPATRPAPTTPQTPRSTVTATLSDVAAGLRRAERHGPDVELVDATHDSRQVGPGGCSARSGQHDVDGHDHAPAAVEAGAAALLVERWLDLPVPQVRVPSVRAAMGPAAPRRARPPERRAHRRRHHRHQRQDDHRLPARGRVRRGGLGTGVIGTIETRIHGDRRPGCAPPPRAPTCSGCSAGCAPGASTRSRWRCPPTGSTCAGSTAPGSPSRPSPTSRRTTSTGTGRWRPTSPPRPGCSPRVRRPGVVHLDGPWARELLDRSRSP